MIISKSHNFIFVHIPKTGGSSIHAVLNQYRWKAPLPVRAAWRFGLRKYRPFYYGIPGHAKALEIREMLPSEIFDTFFRFAFVRNPWALQVSMYHFILQSSHRDTKVVSSKSGFREYVHWLRDKPEYDLQSDFVTDENGELLVDYIGRLETIQEDFTSICDAIGVSKIYLPVKNISSHAGYKKYYDDETIEIIGNMYARDIERFGYIFDK